MNLYVCIMHNISRENIGLCEILIVQHNLPVVQFSLVDIVAQLSIL